MTFTAQTCTQEKYLPPGQATDKMVTASEPTPELTPMAQAFRNSLWFSFFESHGTPFQILGWEVVTLKLDRIKIAMPANCFLSVPPEPGGMLNALPSPLTHSPNDMPIREILDYNVHFTD